MLSFLVLLLLQKCMLLPLYTFILIGKPCFCCPHQVGSSVTPQSMRCRPLPQLLPGQSVPDMGQLLSEQDLLQPVLHQRMERHAGCRVTSCQFTCSLHRSVSRRVTYVHNIFHHLKWSAFFFHRPVHACMLFSTECSRTKFTMVGKQLSENISLTFMFTENNLQAGYVLTSDITSQRIAQLLLTFRFVAQFSTEHWARASTCLLWTFG